MIHPLIASLTPELLSQQAAEQLSNIDNLSTEQLLSQIAQLTQYSLPELAREIALKEQLSYQQNPSLQFNLANTISMIDTLNLEPMVLAYPMLPLSVNNEQLQLLSYDPSIKSLALELQFHHRLTTRVIITDIKQFQSLHNLVLSQLRNHKQPNASFKLLPEIMQQSLQHEASDIHIEPQRDEARIRIRCDGLLMTLMTISTGDIKALISQIKINADLDIAEQRLPQDGRMKYSLSKEQQIELRVSTLPTLWGEKLVMRLAKETLALPKLDELGLNKAQLLSLQTQLHQPQGLILVTGPTGSGKTITLYSCLKAIANDNINICTIEDPVEIYLPGFNQVQVNAQIHFSFAKSLRSLLRQDPDVIMLGEIRDKETAEMAIQAAQTGHLVLSTLHTNSAFDALERLYQLGIEQADLQGSLRLVIAQRLLRKVCSYCAHQPSHQPCYQCNNGYKGRVGIFELLPIDRHILLQAKQQQLTERQIKNHLLANQDLRHSAQHLLQTKITTKEELHRVLGYESQ
ncbi:hypothetical protein A9264_00535 [Vibrio sp. UCD-FRSSP16_10]|uniref:GspE/PulE family protein n=1 Tax=unclassified Vibrio TaxID=2614977 RepID=UPI000801358B|nr:MULTISPECIES: GspE/PulE family protein [unclassified Vibrio]OBT17302.1 hypothetical protein A9260_01985 [Vibrio sp. UCD-FRSSP16_30]OBT23071.1 hypothetical protein A9264_00535 [Vibrio sp. UCD-FRSSP16_10]